MAVTLAVVVLAAGWSWFYTLAAASSSDASKMEAFSRAGFARRQMSADIECGRLSVSPQVCGRDEFALVVSHAESLPEAVAYRYDPVRQVVWRKSASCHVVQGVRSFSVEYLDATGALVPLQADGWLAAGDARRVIALRLSLALEQGSGRPVTWLSVMQPW